ncbi:C-type lectin domain family 4 member G-like isoform X1 [Arapaima gigas]
MDRLGEEMNITLIQKDDFGTEVPTRDFNLECNNHLAMYTVREGHNARRYRFATGSLGLLCIILMLAIIALCVHYKGMVLPSGELEGLRTNHSKMAAGMEKLRADYIVALSEKIDLNQQRDLLKSETASLRKQREDLLEEKKKLQSRLTDQERSCGMCPAGWRLFSSNCYFFSASESSKRKSWDDGRADCIDRGADLVVVDSQEKQMFVNRVIHNMELRNPSVWHLTGFWMGLRDIHTEGIWKWSNGTELTVGYWMDGEPNDQFSVEDCAATYPKVNALKAWNDAPCGTQLYWICEVALKNSSVTQ